VPVDWVHDSFPFIGRFEEIFSGNRQIPIILSHLKYMKIHADEKNWGLAKERIEWEQNLFGSYKLSKKEKILKIP
jgi:hypothetical protein